MIRKILLLVVFSIGFTSASVDEAWRILRKNRGNVNSYPAVINELVKGKLYFASIPYIKEYLVSGSFTKNKESVDRLLDVVITHVGIKQFEGLPVKFLKRSNAPVIRYILAKKYFRLGRLDQTISLVRNSIKESHPVYPFAMSLLATSYSLKKSYSIAKSFFKKCISSSEKSIGKYRSLSRKRQLNINKDVCLAGIARNDFSDKKYERANLSYLDISKQSYIWPEILFEEAWTSFYQGDYNRTLGKLVTYKAPLLKYIFNPEIEVLRTLTFMEMCLWSDVDYSVEQFYKRYEKSSKRLLSVLKKKKRDYRFFYLLGKDIVEGNKFSNKLLKELLHYVSIDPTFIELFEAFQAGKSELEVVSALRNERMQNVFMANLKESLLLQRNLIGAYVRKNLFNHLRKIKNAFQNMSYIRLEVLSKKKNLIYRNQLSGKRNRGDIEYLQRNEKQYFWNFNGEFWADELGDYVFSLRSECN